VDPRPAVGFQGRLIRGSVWTVSFPRWNPRSIVMAFGGLVGLAREVVEDAAAMVREASCLASFPFGIFCVGEEEEEEDEDKEEEEEAEENEEEDELDLVTSAMSVACF